MVILDDYGNKSFHYKFEFNNTNKNSKVKAT